MPRGGACNTVPLDSPYLGVAAASRRLFGISDGSPYPIARHKEDEDLVYWAVDLSSEQEHGVVLELGSKKLCFVEVRTLMVTADWEDQQAMDELAIAGDMRALLEWHKVSHFYGACGGLTVPKEAGRRKQCSNEACGKRVYPRVDPVVIMLVIDRENDRALLSRQARFVPRMWSCLAGFIEPGESLEEAVRRETWEETGIEVREIVYHSSQPWPAESSAPQTYKPGENAAKRTMEAEILKIEKNAEGIVLLDEEEETVQDKNVAVTTTNENSSPVTPLKLD
ncbi:unnamed protein product [Eruca vesicaria subsp. sativa]|uniref:NAD(+) diphosphatase n=1 Tax=Eruca vesicaria subsp. sativa TaxID=29727 RepID=A0ABC8J320_ERUVS|nr:unnamed protein product [Eruca vesicaria subsp. sativa]